MWVKWVVRLFSMVSCSLAWFTLVDISPNGTLDTWPPVVSSNEFLGLVSSRMSSNNRIMVVTENILTKFLVVRNLYSFIVCDNSISMVMPVRVFRLKSYFDGVFISFGFWFNRSRMASVNDFNDCSSS